jgi:hypothetical protein
MAFSSQLFRGRFGTHSAVLSAADATLGAGGSCFGCMLLNGAGRGGGMGDNGDLAGNAQAGQD